MPELIEETTNIAAVVPQAPAPSRIAKQRNYTSLLVAIMIFALVGAVSCGGIFFLYWQSLQPEIEEPLAEIVEEDIAEEVQDISYISFGDYTLPIHQSLAVNDYNQDAFMVDESGIISYEDARLGVDVSQYQGDIDWQAVAEDGVSFAFIRLGFRGYGAEGTIVLDTTFHQNMEGAKAAGLDVGVYFFSQATSVWETLEEAYFVLEQLEGYTLDLPVVFNWEFIDNNGSARTNSVSGQSITLYNQVFMEQMEKSGYDTMIYFNQTLGYLYLDLELLSDHPFWLASYRDYPTFYYDFDLWQYSDNGTINGIEGDVDLNLMLTDFTH